MQMKTQITKRKKKADICERGSERRGDGGDGEIKE